MYRFLRRQVKWETMETVADFIFLGSKITADGDCSDGVNTVRGVASKLRQEVDSGQQGQIG